MQFLNNLFFSKLEEQFNKLSNISNLFLLKKEKVYTPKKKYNTNSERYQV